MSRRDVAKSLLAKDATCSSAVYMSMLTLFGPKLMEYEFETLRLECQRMGIDVADQNWEELFAALALRGDGRFVIDAATFENTLVALNGGEPDPHNLQPAIPAHIAWGVSEADIIVSDLIKGDLDEYLDYETVGYAATLCKAYGMVCVPDCLEFCEERLEELTPGRDKLRSDVKKAWGEQRDVPPGKIEFQEDPIGVQLALMHAVREYVRTRTKARDKQLHSLL